MGDRFLILLAGSKFSDFVKLISGELFGLIPIAIMIVASSPAKKRGTGDKAIMIATWPVPHQSCAMIYTFQSRQTSS